MNKKTNPLEFCEDSFELGSYKKAAMGESRKKSETNRAKRQISFGKAILTIAAMIVFALLFFLVMNALGQGAY